MNRSLFKRLAERHQEEFKKNVLHLDKCGVFRNPRTKEQVPVQRFLTDEDAEAGMIFYEGFRKEILDAAKSKYDFHGRHKSMYVDMLRSELGREYADERFAKWVTYLKDRYLF